MKTLADKKFTNETEEDVIRLLLRDVTFNEKYNTLLHPSYFFEYLRPFVEICQKYWRQYRKLIPDAALIQELTQKLGIGFTEEKLNACLSVLERVNKDPLDPEWTADQIDHFLHFRATENAWCAGADILEAAEKNNDPTKLKELNTEQYRSIQYLADQLGIPHHTVRWWIRAGKLETIKIGKRVLIPQSAIDALIEQAAEPGKK